MKGAIGFDMDGVLAHFTRGYQDLIVMLSGRDLFQPGDVDNAPCWDWDKFRGYTPEERKAAWGFIKESATFWRELPPLPGAHALADAMPKLLHDRSEVYFVTQRLGHAPETQTRDWLYFHVGKHLGAGWYPEVRVVPPGNKAAMCQELQLTAYIDDFSVNVLDCITNAPKTRTYVLDYAHNQGFPLPGALRVSSVATMLSIEDQIEQP